MKKFILWMSIASFVVLSGCAHVRMVKPKEGCRSLLIMSSCEDVNEPTPTPNLDIKGDKSAKDYPDYY